MPPDRVVDRARPSAQRLRDLGAEARRLVSDGLAQRVAERLTLRDVDGERLGERTVDRPRQCALHRRLSRAWATAWSSSAAETTRSSTRCSTIERATASGSGPASIESIARSTSSLRTVRPDRRPPGPGEERRDRVSSGNRKPGVGRSGSPKRGDAAAPEQEESRGMTTQRTTSAAPRLSRWRRFSIWTLIFVASLIAVVGISTLWVKRQILDDQSFRDASADVIADPDVRNSLSIFLVNQLYDNVDVAAAIETRLPEGAKSIAGTLAGALRQPATNAINQLLSRRGYSSSSSTPARWRTTSWSTCSRTRPASGSRPGKVWSRSICTSSSPSSPSSSGCPGKNRQDPGRRRRDHSDEVEPAGRPPEGCEADPRPQRLAAGPRARPLRARDLSSRAATGARPCGTSAGPSRSSGCSCC